MILERILQRFTKWWRETALSWLLQIVRHPWQSLVSLAAAIGDFVLWLFHLLARAARWMWRQIRRLVNVSLWGLAKGVIVACLVLFLLGCLLTAFLISSPTTKVPDFQP